MPVAYRACVGDLSLTSELALGVADRVVGAPDASGLGGVALRAGGDLQAPELLSGERWLGVGVVLLAGEQAPEQARELSGGCHDRHRVTAARTYALIERVQRTGLADRGPTRLHQHVTGAYRALL